MSAVPPKHPKKKRRIEQEPQPGPSSGANVRGPRIGLRHLRKRVLHSCTNSLPSNSSPAGFIKASQIHKAVTNPSSSEGKDVLTGNCSTYQNEDGSKTSVPTNPLSPGFVKSSKIHEVACSLQTVKSSGSKETYPLAGSEVSLPNNPLSPGFTNASFKAAHFASGFSDDNDLQPTRRSKRQYRKMPLSSNLKQGSSGPLSPEFVTASNVLKTLHASSKSDSSPEDENMQATKCSKGVGSKRASLLPKEDVDSACFLPNANTPSGSKPSFEMSNCKKGKSRVDNKKRRTNIPCNSSKITKYFLAANKTAQRETVKKRTRSSTKIHKTRISVGWDKKNEDILETITDNEQFFKRYRDRYGLVENSIEDTGEDYFSSIPTPIIELILCTVPIIDFMNCRLVCRRWRDIIDNPRFMKWKKMYYKYKKDPCRKEVMKAVMMPLHHIAVEGCVETLINFMGKGFSRMPSTDMYDLLLQNPHGELADHVLKERFPKLKGKDSRVWCQVCVAMLICESVWDVLGVYKSLMRSGSGCLRTDLHDALYCFALFLFHFRCTENINSGLHYRIYYALYVIENSIPHCQRDKVQRIKNIPGQQNIQNYGESDGDSLTYEQIRVLNHRFDMNQKIKIVALAGSGKTTTLVHLARLYPQIRFLNIVFNKSVNREAKRKFPSNVVCKTAHSIAYEAVGSKLRHKLVAVIQPYYLISHIRHNDAYLHVYMYTKMVQATICNFMYSRDEAVALHHVPQTTPENKQISPANRERVLLDAQKIWQKMADKMSNVKITHDVYLKLYQLSKPKLDQYQCIMVDEAQDCNPAILDIVMSQSIPVIFVGDPNQQIYAFRGVKNALQQIKATHTYCLTKSFRFGPQISYMATCVLEVSLNMMENVLVGNTSDSNLRGEATDQFAVIARSNIVLINEAIRMVVFHRLKPHEPQDIHPFFAGGIESYGFDQIMQIYLLKCSNTEDIRKAKDKFICGFDSFYDLENYAKLSNDKDLLNKIDLVNQHLQHLPNFLQILKQRCSTTSLKNATVVFTTAHKSKGLEFDTVSLTDDYIISPNSGDTIQEEANILYVAITRAKRCLFLPEKITKLLHAAHEKFEYPVSSKALMKSSVDLKCAQCDTVFVPHTTLAIVRRKIVMASGREWSEGPLCMKCRSSPTMRPDVHLNGLIMYLDPVPDNSHRVMNALAGPLPSDPPIVYDRFNDFVEADGVFVINLNIH